MAKKRRKVFRRQADRSWKELKPRKKRRKPSYSYAPPKRMTELGEWISQDKLRELLRPMIREAARAGLVEAIEHSSNFWNVSDGYKNYIDQQIKTQAEALMAAVKAALREDHALRELRHNYKQRQKR